jgi:hypothetical protein
MAQVAGSQVVVVRLASSLYGTTGIINYGNGKTEAVSFKVGTTDKAMISASSDYQALFSRLYQEGYSLKSTFSESNGIVNVVFVKGQ